MKELKRKLKKVMVTVIMAQLLLTVVSVSSNEGIMPCIITDYNEVVQL